MEQQPSVDHPSLQQQQQQQQQRQSQYQRQSQSHYVPVAVPAQPSQQQRQTHLTYLSNQPQLLTQQATIPIEPRPSPQSRQQQRIHQHQQALDNKKRAPPCRWLPADDAAMVRILLQEKRAGNETEHGFLPSSWDKVVEALQSTTSQGQPKTVGPCKDRYKLMIRTIYLPFKELRSNPDFEWNEDEQRFIAPDPATWERYVETHPHAVKFKTTGFPLFAEFEELVGHKRSIAGLSRGQSPLVGSPLPHQTHPQPQNLAGEQGQSGMDGTFDLMDDPASYLYSSSTPLNSLLTKRSKRPFSLEPIASNKRACPSTPVPAKDEPTIKQLIGLVHRLSESVEAFSRRLSYQQPQQRRQSSSNSITAEDAPSLTSILSPSPMIAEGVATTTKMRATSIIDSTSVLTPDIKLKVILRLVWDDSLAQVVCGLSEHGGLRDDFLREIGKEEAAAGEQGEVAEPDVDMVAEEQSNAHSEAEEEDGRDPTQEV